VADESRVQNIVEEAFSLQSGINQDKKEIILLLRYLSDYDIKTYLEIGTENGGTLWLFSKFMPEDSLAISVDTDVPSVLPKLPGQCHLVVADSRDNYTVHRISKILAGRQVDLLLIDGNHNIAGYDFERYSILVRHGGIVLFHDINPNGPRHNVGTVPEVWLNTKDKYKHVEFVANNPDGFGIGLINMPCLPQSSINRNSLHSYHWN
jgi:predicted O-methyltransferase YrrM